MLLRATDVSARYGRIPILNGIDLHLIPSDVTYTLNSDCTGTYAVTGTPLTFAVFVSPNGDEITTINTNAGASSSYPPSRRVWPK